MDLRYDEALTQLVEEHDKLPFLEVTKEYFRREAEFLIGKRHTLEHFTKGGKFQTFHPLPDVYLTRVEGIPNGAMLIGDGLENAFKNLFMDGDHYFAFLQDPNKGRIGLWTGWKKQGEIYRFEQVLISQTYYDGLHQPAKKPKK